MCVYFIFIYALDRVLGCLNKRCQQMTLYTNVGGGKPCARVSETAKAQQPVASACLLKSHPVSMMCVRAFHTGHRVSAKPNKPKFYSTTRFFIFFFERERVSANGTRYKKDRNAHVLLCMSTVLCGNHRIIQIQTRIACYFSKCT